MARKPKPGWRLRQREANFLCLYSAYRKRAKKSGRAFDLPAERFRELVTSDCFVCGAPPSLKYRHSKQPCYRTPFVYNGIDRINNRKGYVEGNVASCCWECNRAKGSRSLEQLLLYIYRAYKHAVEPALEEGTPDDEYE